jgi:UrcA family protein
MTMNTLTACNGLRGLIAGSIVSAFALGFGAPCLAADGADSISSTLVYQQSAASDTKAAETLYKRIQRTAQQVCARNGDAGGYFRHDIELCVHNAISDAVTAVNGPALTTVYNAKNQPRPILLASAQTR